jgi:hypothetical protein
MISANFPFLSSPFLSFPTMPYNLRPTPRRVAQAKAAEAAKKASMPLGDTTALRAALKMLSEMTVRRMLFREDEAFFNANNGFVMEHTNNMLMYQRDLTRYDLTCIAMDIAKLRSIVVNGAIGGPDGRMTFPTPNLVTSTMLRCLCDKVTEERKALL